MPARARTGTASSPAPSMQYIPVRVEYSLTQLGWTTTEAVVAFSDWAKDHSADVRRARSEFWHRHIDPDPILEAGHVA